ncbi:MAG: (2Fe-2S)-binding protein [Myxococcaceae bacterium]|nr:(2Fe-2S)-binding protein [Myxococcaceae bacterium]
MTSASHAVSFKSASHPPVQVPRGKNLSLHLTASNSPVLFGCRTGICGTCMSHVRVVAGELVPPNEDERESLDVNGAPSADCRLLCQIDVSADIEVDPVGDR